jgi:hypothetical protein
MFRGEGKPDGANEKRCGQSGIGLIGKGEIGNDAAGEEHGEPEEPAVGLRFKRAGHGYERR